MSWMNTQISKHGSIKFKWVQLYIIHNFISIQSIILRTEKRNKEEAKLKFSQAEEKGKEKKDGRSST